MLHQRVKHVTQTPMLLFAKQGLHQNAAIDVTFILILHQTVTTICSEDSARGLLLSFFRFAQMEEDADILQGHHARSILHAIVHNLALCVAEIYFHLSKVFLVFAKCLSSSLYQYFPNC